MSGRSIHLAALMAGTALGAAGLASVAAAQGPSVRLDEISVEAASPGSSAPAPSPGSGGTNLSGDVGSAVTGGGGGDPSGITGYTARVATAGTKTDTPVIEVPQAISVVTREQLDDYNAQTFAEATANLAPGTNLTIAYARVDIRFLNGTAVDPNGNTVPVAGNRVSGVPGDAYASVLTYAFPPPSALRGLQIGGGIRYIGTSPVDDADSAHNATATLYDALIARDFGAIDPKYRGLRAQIDGSNIFDRNCTTCAFGFCNRNRPGTVIASPIYLW